MTKQSHILDSFPHLTLKNLIFLATDETQRKKVISVFDCFVPRNDVCVNPWLIFSESASAEKKEKTGWIVPCFVNGFFTVL